MKRFAVILFAGAAVLSAGSSALWGAAAPTVQVGLAEMAVKAKPASVPAGRVTFVVKNTGSVEHELVVVRGGGALRVKGFKADEHGRDLGEIEDIAPGKSGRLTLTLTPGTYSLICNVVGHYQLGMRGKLVVR